MQSVHRESFLKVPTYFPVLDNRCCRVVRFGCEKFLPLSHLLINYRGIMFYLYRELRKLDSKDLFIKIRTRSVVTLLLFLYEFLWISLYVRKSRKSLFFALILPKSQRNLFPNLCRIKKKMRIIILLGAIWHNKADL